MLHAWTKKNKAPPTTSTKSIWKSMLNISQSETTQSIQFTKSQSLVDLVLEKVPLCKRLRSNFRIKDSVYFRFPKYQLWLSWPEVWSWWPNSIFSKELSSKVCWLDSKCTRKITSLNWQKWANHPLLCFAIEEWLTLLLMSPKRNSRPLWTNKDGLGLLWEIEDTTESSFWTPLPMEPKSFILSTTTLRDQKD